MQTCCGEKRRGTGQQEEGLNPAELTEELEAIENDNPTLKGQIRGLALDRAQRFGVNLERITVTMSSARRRLSVAMDDHDTLMSVDPSIADAVSRVRAKSGSSDSLPTTKNLQKANEGVGDIQLVEARLNHRLDGLAAQLQIVIEAQARAALEVEHTSLAGVPPLATPQPPPGLPPNRVDRRSSHEGTS